MVLILIWPPGANVAAPLSLKGIVHLPAAAARLTTSTRLPSQTSDQNPNKLRLRELD